jgi:hypothetical protein
MCTELLINLPIAFDACNLTPTHIVMACAENMTLECCVKLAAKGMPAAHSTVELLQSL